MHDNHFDQIEQADAVAWILCITLGVLLGVLAFYAAVTA